MQYACHDDGLDKIVWSLRQGSSKGGLILKKIVVINDSIQSRGGATSLARLSAQLYRKQGFEVTYITGAVDDGSLQQYGINVVSLGAQTLLRGTPLKSMVSGIHNRETVQSIGAWIAENDDSQTAYHLHNWAQILSPSIFKALRDVETRTVMTCHDMFNTCPNGVLVNFKSMAPCELTPMSASCWLSQCDKRNALQKYWRMLRQTRLKQLARFERSQITFVCIQSGMQDLFEKTGFTPENITCITNPATTFSTERVRAEDNKGFLFIGRINAGKGADILAQVANDVDVPLTLIGEGELAEDIAETYPKVTLPGFRNREEISEYVQQARALVFPSRWREPYGLVIAEAALSGLPILISRPSLLSQQVSDLEFGEAFDPIRPDDLAARLTRWSSDNDLVRRYSENAFNRANQICFSPTEWGDQYIQLLDQKVRSAAKQA